jgi:hypothetical protein
VHFFNFSDTDKGLGPTTSDIVLREIRQLGERFTIMGFRLAVLYDPTTDILNLPSGSPIDLNNVKLSTNGLASTDELALIGLVRGVSPANTANANTLYVAVVRNLRIFGESFPDGDLQPGSLAARNFCFIAGMMPDNDFTSAHEIIAHMFDNQTLTDAEDDGTAPGWAPGGHYGGPPGRGDVQFNLCARDAATSNPVADTDPLRIWDDPIHLFQQITRARTATRYLQTP